MTGQSSTRQRPRQHARPGGFRGHAHGRFPRHAPAPRPGLRNPFWGPQNPTSPCPRGRTGPAAWWSPGSRCPAPQKSWPTSPPPPARWHVHRGGAGVCVCVGRQRDRLPETLCSGPASGPNPGHRTGTPQRGSRGPFWLPRPRPGHATCSRAARPGCRMGVAGSRERPACKRCRGSAGGRASLTSPHLHPTHTHTANCALRHSAQSPGARRGLWRRPGAAAPLS